LPRHRQDLPLPTYVSPMCPVYSVTHVPGPYLPTVGPPFGSPALRADAQRGGRPLLVMEGRGDLVLRIRRRERRHFDDYALQLTPELERRLIIIADRKAAIAADEQTRAADLPAHRQAARQWAFSNDTTVDAEHHRALRARPTIFGDDRVLACCNRFLRGEPKYLAKNREGDHRASVEQIARPAVAPVAERAEDAGSALADLDLSQQAKTATERRQRIL